MKEEPNPQFFKDSSLPKPNYPPTQTFKQQIKSQKGSQNNFFDFGISDDDWSNFKTPKQKEKQTLMQEENKGLNQSSKVKDFAELSTQQSNQNTSDKTIQQKKLKLQQVYLLSKKRRSHKKKQETELEQIMKFNNQNQSVSKFVQTPNRVSSKEFQQDFFSLAEKQDQQQAQFSVFDRPSYNSSDKKHSNSSQQFSFKEDQQNSAQKIENFQTESLLQSEQGTKLKVFSSKHLEQSLCFFKFGIHLVSITLVSIMFGFMSSLVFLILHDFSQFLCVILQLILKGRTKKALNLHQLSKRRMLLPMSDEISQTHDFSNNQTSTSCYVKYEKNIRTCIKFHSFFKSSLYVSSMSLIGFIIFHITQIDTFFTTNYFSLMNWSSLLVLIIILVVEGIWNLKMVTKIEEIIFYEKNVLQDVRVLNEKSKTHQERRINEENLWQS